MQCIDPLMLVPGVAQRAVPLLNTVARRSGARTLGVKSAVIKVNRIFIVGRVGWMALSIFAATFTCNADSLPNYDQWPVFDVKSLGAIGDGVTDDSSAFAIALQRASQAGHGVVFFPSGNYLLNGSKINSTWGSTKLSILPIPNSQIVIKGLGPKESRLFTNQEATLLQGINAPSADLTLIDLALECKSGFSTGYASYAMVFAGTSLRAQNVEFKNWKDGIRIPEGLNPQVSYLLIQNCRFLYDYGRAGVAQFDSNYQDPVVAILGGGQTTHIYDTVFNGLIDPSFKSVSTDKNRKTTVAITQFTPVDGLIKTINQVTNLVIQRCAIKNFNVEGILVEGNLLTTAPRIDISANSFVGFDPNFRVIGSRVRPAVGQIQTFYQDTPGTIPSTAIQIDSGDGGITNNSIVDAHEGIGVTNSSGISYEALTISGNYVAGCITAIGVSGASNTAISSNRISFGRNFTEVERQVGDASAISGISVTNSPNAQIIGNVIYLQHANWWAGETILAQDLKSGATFANVTVPIATSGSYQIYIGNYTPIWGQIFASGQNNTAGQIQFSSAVYPSPTIPAGTPVHWINEYTTSDWIHWFESACVMNYSSAGVVSKQNVFSGGFFSIRATNGQASVTSTGDTFLNYDFSPTISGPVTVN
jgi:hypothetical protein